MLEIILMLCVGVLRVIDGMSKKTWPKWNLAIPMINKDVVIKTSTISAFLTRATPAAIFFVLVSPNPHVWEEVFIAVMFSAGLSWSFQKGYEDWKSFLEQSTHHWPGMLGYGFLYYINPWITVWGICGCFLANFTHPVLAKTSIKNYTQYAEFISGALLAAGCLII